MISWGLIDLTESVAWSVRRDQIPGAYPEAACVQEHNGVGPGRVRPGQVPVWVKHERERLDHPNRKRAIGGGRPYKLSLQDRLIMVLTWLRLYLNTEALGFFFGLDKSNVSRNCRRLLAVLRTLGDATLGWPDPPKRGEGKTAEEALREMLAIVDATEQRIRRPSNDTQQRQHYSGKKKAHTRKTGLVVDEHGRIRAATPSAPGSRHDLKLVVEIRLPPGVTVLGDAGLEGLQNYYPHRSIGTPHKARRNHPLTWDQKLANRELSCIRIVVENTVCQLKHFQILAQQFRHALGIYDDVFLAVVGLVNHRLDRRLCRKAVA